MGHAKLVELSYDHSLWTGDGLEGLYVRTPKREEVEISSGIIYEQLAIELRNALVDELNEGDHDYITLAAALNLLRSGVSNG